MDYIGYLHKDDPLYGYLRFEILPQIGVIGSRPKFRVYKFRASNYVYLYEDERSQSRLIGKYFGGVSGRSSQAALRSMEREFNNLTYAREIGFNRYPHYFPRPIGRNAGINFVLVEEFCYGISFHEVIFKAIRKEDSGVFFQKLTALGYFLAALHNKTATGVRVDFNQACSYFDRIIDQLKRWGHVSWDEAQDFYRLKDRWREKGCVWEDSTVTVHGDVTPMNILFGDDLWVIPIDLERMKQADRVFDIGRVAGEIKHFFMQYTGNSRLAEPFIGHFLWEYSCHFPDRETTFSSIARRLPFYMGLTLLRIARNSWISNEYRRELLEEVKRTLR